MKNKNTRSLIFDENLGKYVLLIENETPIVHENKEVGTQKNTIKQIWDKENILIVKEQIIDQKNETEKKLKNIISEIKGLKKMTDREKQQLIDFREKLAKVQDLNKLEQLTQAKKNHEDAIIKINKDLKEIEDAVSD